MPRSSNAAASEKKTKPAPSPKPAKANAKVKTKKAIREPAETRSGVIAIVGRPNVGKSTLVNALVGEHVSIVSHHPQTTRDRVMGLVNETSIQLALVDTPGVHNARNKLGTRMNHEAREAAEGADVVLFVTDVGRSLSTSGEDLLPQDREVLASLPKNKPVILVINKIDRLVDKKLLMPILAKRSEAFPFAAVVPISAQSKSVVTSGVGRLRKEIDDRIPKGPKLYDEEIFSDRPARFFVQEYVREQVLRRTREEVPHGVAVTIDRWDEGKNVPRIEVTIHVDKPNHKKIVVGEGGSVLKDVGTRARARVEQLLGKSVMLKLWVRVTPGWYESDRLLRDLGYGDGT